MPNIIDGINKMDKEQLSAQLATLKIVTMSNVLSEMKQKTSKKATQLFNGVRRLFDVAPVKEPNVVSFDKRIADCKSKLDCKTREELIHETRAVLQEKLKALSVSMNNEPSDDELSICVIEAASKNFKKEINTGLSPSQKADAIYQRYNERLIAQTQKKYAHATQEEKEKINKQLQEEIDAMNDEQREELKKALRVDEVTGETMKKFLTTSAGASTLLVALNLSGFGAFMALTTIMHAVFTTTLGITLPFAVYTSATTVLSFFLGPAGWIIFAGAELVMLNNNSNKIIYELLAQVVWASVLECGGRLTPKDDMLPSWMPEEQRQIAMSNNREFMELQKKYDVLIGEAETLKDKICKFDNLQQAREAEILSLKEKIKNKEQQLEKATENMEQLENGLSKAKQEFEQYKRYSDSENDDLRQKYTEAQKNYQNAEKKIKNKQNEINSLKKSNKDSEDMILMYEDELARVGKEKQLLETEKEQMKVVLEHTKEKLDVAELKEAKKLQERWEAAYKRFEFDSKVFKYVVKNYQFNEYGYIERHMIELHEAKDPAALRSNRGKMAVSGKLHLEISSSSGVPSRLFYIPLKNSGNGKTVKITDIVKHNDSRYGKI